MGLDINKLDLPALTALASKAATDLNLKRVGFDPDNALSLFVNSQVQGNKLQQDYALMAQQAALEQMKERGLDKRLAFTEGAEDKRTAANNATEIDKTKLKALYDQQMTPYQEAQLGLQAKNLDLNAANTQGLQSYREGVLKSKQEQVMLDKYKTEIEKTAKLDDNTKAAKASAAMYFLTSNVDPKVYTSGLVSQGLMSKQEQKAFLDKTSEEQKALASAYVGADNAASIYRSKTMGQAAETSYDKAAAGVFQKEQENILAQQDARPGVMNALQNAEGILNSAGADEELKPLLGPVVNFTKLNSQNSKVQELKAHLNNLALRYRASVKMPGSLSDQDVKFLTNIVGNTAVNMDTLRNILHKASEFEKKQTILEYNKQDAFFSRTKDYDKWKQSNPVPNLSYWQPKEQSGQSPQQGQSIQGQNPQQPRQFQEGQVYQDANGNKAKYINGQWEIY